MNNDARNYAGMAGPTPTPKPKRQGNAGNTAAWVAAIAIGVCILIWQIGLKDDAVMNLPERQKNSGSAISIDEAVPAHTDNFTIEEEQRKLCEELQADIADYANSNKLQISASVFRDEGRGVVVRLPASLIFAADSTDIKPEAEGLLILIGESMSRFDNEMRVECHTDNVPINTADHIGNGSFSTKRADTVSHFLARYASVDGHKLYAWGQSDEQPIADNGTPEGREQNRRIEIILLYD